MRLMSEQNTDDRLPRTFSTQGLAAMMCGLGLAAFEMRYQFMLMRLGLGGRIVVMLLAASLSIWGLKEVIAGLFPSLGHHGLARHRFNWPMSGRIYAVIMMVLFIGSMLGRSNTLLMIFCMLAAAFVLNGWMSFTMLRYIDVDRSLPPRVMAGEPSSVELTLRNRKSWLSIWVMTVHDQIRHHADHLVADVLFLRVGPSSERSGHYRMLLNERGRYLFGPMQVNTRFPLGLVERGLNLAKTDTILVYPRVGRLTPGWRNQLPSATELMQQAVSRGGPFNDEFHKLREYRVGDDLRAVHWRTTARRNELMIREFQESRDRQLLFLLDGYHRGSPTHDERNAMELALSFATTVCIDHLHNSRESPLAFAAVGEQQIAWESRQPVESLLDSLAVFEPSMDADPKALLAAAMDFNVGATRTILVTPRPVSIGKTLAEMSTRDELGRRGFLQGVQIVSMTEADLGRFIMFE